MPLARSRQVIVALKDPTVTHVVFADADIEFHPGEQACVTVTPSIASDEPVLPRRVNEKLTRDALADDVERLLAIDRDVVGIPAPMHQGGMRWDVMLEVTHQNVSCSARPRPRPSLAPDFARVRNPPVAPVLAAGGQGAGCPPEGSPL